MLNKVESITILAIETSCDDTSASILKNGNILANVASSQPIHSKYGGVVPELASREHSVNLLPIIEKALKISQTSKAELTAIAFTRGPGLIGSLLIGVNFAKALAFSLQIPLIEVNHLQAHVLAHFIDEPKPAFPFLCLTVSGGHTQLVLVHNHLEMEVIGKSIDDAAGEAFDKTAKMLGLSYPGGPAIDRLAQLGNPIAFSFSKPKVNELDFSFSGLKTSVLYFLQKEMKKNPQFIKENLNDLCASVQHTIVSILLEKLLDAAQKTGVKSVGISGGVAANSLFRSEFKKLGRQMNWQIFIPKFEYCTDNAAMIAITGYFKYLQKDFSDFDVEPNPRITF